MLRAYAGKLIARLPKTTTGGTTGSAGAGTQDWYIKLNDEDVVVVCTIIATAEYCNEVVGALGRNVAKTLDPPFGSQVFHTCQPLLSQLGSIVLVRSVAAFLACMLLKTEAVCQLGVLFQAFNARLQQQLLPERATKALRVCVLLQVSVSEEEDEFQLVITACLSVLILGTETKLDSALTQMTRLPWASLESVRSLSSVFDRDS